MNQKLSSILRVAAYAVLLLVVCVLQCSLGVRVTVFGAHIDLLPLILSATGVLLGPGAGLACGLAVGVLYDASGATIEGLYPLYYMICGMAAGYFGAHVRRHETIGVMLCSACMITLLSLLRYVFYFQFVSDTSILIFARDMAIQALLAIVLSPFVLMAVRRISGKRRHRSDRISTDPQT